MTGWEKDASIFSLSKEYEDLLRYLSGAVRSMENAIGRKGCQSLGISTLLSDIHYNILTAMQMKTILDRRLGISLPQLLQKNGLSKEDSQSLYSLIADEPI